MYGIECIEEIFHPESALPVILADRQFADKCKSLAKAHDKEGQNAHGKSLVLFLSEHIYRNNGKNSPSAVIRKENFGKCETCECEKECCGYTLLLFIIPAMCNRKIYRDSCNKTDHTGYDRSTKIRQSECGLKDHAHDLDHAGHCGIGTEASRNKEPGL